MGVSYHSRTTRRVNRRSLTLAIAAGLAASPIAAQEAIDLLSLDGPNGFVINGIDADGYSGFSVSAAGDVNGDGIDDVIIGAPGAGPDNSGEGESYVVFGSDQGFASSLGLSALNGSNGFVINGIDAGDRSGGSVSAAGDVNGDGIDDVIIGARLADPGGNSSAGESYVVFGRNTSAAGPFAASLELSALNGSNGFVINGIDAVDFSGGSVSAAGDVNGDSIDDVIIGAPIAGPGTDRQGESYVLFGRNTPIVGPFAASLELSALNGSNGFVISGIDAGDYSGFSVSAAGDVNGDGIDDVIIGTREASVGTRGEGESYVVFGRNTPVVGPFAASLELSALDGSNGFAISGIDTLDRSGQSVGAAGDVNGDGIDDVIIGAHFADPGGNSSAGESYVVFGRNTSVVGPFEASLELSALNGSNGFVINGIDAGDRSGGSVSAAGDVNGDGIDDVIIGADFANPGKSYEGESYVVFGRLSFVDTVFADGFE